jgi:adenylate kinase family enzyme
MSTALSQHPKEILFPQPLRRVVVIGPSGAGKTTMARELSRRLGVPHVELDALHWGPDWSLPTVEAFRERVAAALGGEEWSTDGNYSAVRDLVWGRAQVLVWLDYALPVFMTRLVTRTLRRVVQKEELWNGNRERLSNALFARDSLLSWTLSTYRKRRRKYVQLLDGPEFSHLAVVRLRSLRATREWLAGLVGSRPE